MKEHCLIALVRVFRLRVANGLDLLVTEREDPDGADGRVLGTQIQGVVDDLHGHDVAEFGQQQGLV